MTNPAGRLFRGELLMNFAENLVKLFREYQKNDRYTLCAILPTKNVRMPSERRFHLQFFL